MELFMIEYFNPPRTRIWTPGEDRIGGRLKFNFLLKDMAVGYEAGPWYFQARRTYAFSGFSLPFSHYFYMYHWMNLTIRCASCRGSSFVGSRYLLGCYNGSPVNQESNLSLSL